MIVSVCVLDDIKITSTAIKSPKNKQQHQMHTKNIRAVFIWIYRFLPGCGRKKKIGFADRNHLLRRVISRIVSLVGFTMLKMSPIGLKMKVALSLSI